MKSFTCDRFTLCNRAGNGSDDRDLSQNGTSQIKKRNASGVFGCFPRLSQNGTSANAYLKRVFRKYPFAFVSNWDAEKWLPIDTVSSKPFAHLAFQIIELLGIKIALSIPCDSRKEPCHASSIIHRRQPASRNLNLVD